MIDPGSLFRQDAIRHRLSRHQSQVLLNRSTHMRPFLWLLCVCVIGLVLAINRTNYKEVLSARGRLLAEEGVQQLVAPQSGVVEAILVAAGETVNEGDVVAQISRQLYNQHGEEVSEQERQILAIEYKSIKQEKQLAQESFNARIRDIGDKIDERKQSIGFAREELAVLREQETISESLLAGSFELLRKHAISEAQARGQRMAHLDKVRDRQQAERQLQALKADSRELAAALQVLLLEQQQTLQRMDQRITATALQLERVGSASHLSVLANRAGVVSSIPVEIGSAVRAGQALVYMQADGKPLTAEVFVPSAIMGKLAPGQEVMLRYDPFDVHSYGRYPATITGIDRTPWDQREHLLPAVKTTEPLFRIQVLPEQHYVEGEDIYPLQPGLLLTADFVVNELSMIQYILKPVFELRGKFS